MGCARYCMHFALHPFHSWMQSISCKIKKLNETGKSARRTMLRQHICWRFVREAEWRGYKNCKWTNARITYSTHAANWPCVQGSASPLERKWQSGNYVQRILCPSTLARTRYTGLNGGWSQQRRVIFHKTYPTLAFSTMLFFTAPASLAFRQKCMWQAQSWISVNIGFSNAKHWDVLKPCGGTALMPSQEEMVEPFSAVSHTLSGSPPIINKS